MASQVIINNPILKAALEQKQQNEAIAQQQQQAYYNKLAEIEKGKIDALSEIESELSGLPENIKSGAGVQWDLGVERKRIERDAEFAKIALAPESKGAAEMISMLGKKYPESELKPFTDTDTFRQTNETFSKISEKFRVADILNQQLKTMGDDLALAKQAEANKDPNTAAFYRERARAYGIAQLSQNLANAVNPNAQQRDEFIRAAESLITPGLIMTQGGGIKQTLGSIWEKLRSPNITQDQDKELRSSLAKMIGDSVSANPEKWYGVAQLGNKDFMAEKTRLLQDQVINRVGVRHAVQMGARKPVVNDPLAEYMAKSQKAPQQEYGAPLNQSGALTITTGAGTSIPVQSGSMQAGTVSSGTVMPTSRSRTKFTVLTPQ